MFTKRIAFVSGDYDLAVAKREQTCWHWYAFLLQDGAVLAFKKPVVNEREEAMKEAHFLANYRENISQDYPEDLHSGWHEVQMADNVIPFPSIT